MRRLLGIGRGSRVGLGLLCGATLEAAAATSTLAAGVNLPALADAAKSQGNPSDGNAGRPVNENSMARLLAAKDALAQGANPMDIYKG